MFVFIDGFVHQLPDIDPDETPSGSTRSTRSSTVAGKPAARFLLARLMERAREQGVGVPAMVHDRYINTIPPEQEPWFPGDEDIERRIRAFIRWNAVVMVDRANNRFDGLGGHLSTYASAAIALRGRLQPLLPRQGRRRRRRPGLLPGPRRARHLRPRLPRGPAHRGPARPLPPRGRRRRPAVVPAPAAACPTSGSSRRSRWASARSTRSTRPASTATSTTAASPTPATSRVWCFVGDGEMDEPEALGGARRSRPASSSTT